MSSEEQTVQVGGVTIKRAVLLGAAQVTIAEAEEYKARTDEAIKALTESMFEYGAKLDRARELLKYAESRTGDDEMMISLREFAAIAAHIPER